MPEQKKFELTLPTAIVIAGVVIAFAIVLTNTGASAAPSAAQPEGPVDTAVSAPGASDHWYGSRTAPVVLIEYSDFQCPFCSSVHPTLKRLVDESGGEVAWVLRNLPLVAIHPQARPAAIAAECVAQVAGNDAYWRFADKLFEQQSMLGPGLYQTLAAQLGVASGPFASCLADASVGSLVDAQSKEAQGNGGLGTPYTVVWTKDKQKGVSGALPYEAFTLVIQQMSGRQQ